MSILITLIIISIILIFLVSIYLNIKTKLSMLSKKVFGTSNIIEGFKNQELELSNNPKSVASLDSVEIPKILEDFPNLNVSEIKSMADNAIIMYYKSLEKGKVQFISNATDKFNNKIQTNIEELQNNNIKYSDIKIHRTVINSYKKNKGICTITTQTSLEYIKKKNNDTRKIQERVNTELIYIYDDSKLEEKYGVSLNCKNCGAPIKDLGNKSCPYCGTGVIDYSSKTWKVDDLYNV